MERAIQHVHVRRFLSPRAEVVELIDALWSRTASDALPRELGGWRRTPEGAHGFATGTRFGHGPFSFQVEQWDGQTLRARIETAGFRGHHGFTLRREGEEMVLTHWLEAQVELLRWLGWRAFIARGHDWAVEAMFDRMHGLLGDQPAALAPAPPLGMRTFVAVRRLA